MYEEVDEVGSDFEGALVGPGRKARDWELFRKVGLSGR